MNAKIWMILTIILAIALVSVLVMSYGGTGGGSTAIGLPKSSQTPGQTPGDPGPTYKHLEEGITGVVADWDVSLVKPILVIIYDEDGTVKYVELNAQSVPGKIDQMRGAINNNHRPFKVTTIYDDGSHKSIYYKY